MHQNDHSKHPPYSLDPAMCDFWQFFNDNNNKFQGHCFHSEDKIDEAAKKYFS